MTSLQWIERRSPHGLTKFYGFGELTFPCGQKRIVEYAGTALPPVDEKQLSLLRKSMAAFRADVEATKVWPYHRLTRTRDVRFATVEWLNVDDPRLHS